MLLTSTPARCSGQELHRCTVLPTRVGLNLCRGCAVKVDVDVLNPVIKSVKQVSQDIYRGLPPPVQRALPFVSVGFAAGFVVYSIQAKRLANEVSSRWQPHVAWVRQSRGPDVRSWLQQGKSARLTDRVEALLAERDDLQYRVKDLKVGLRPVYRGRLALPSF